jgi:uncharacterized protein YlbG (UPF0298 family)
LERSFEKFGKIKDLSFKSRYAFIEYEDYHSARDAVDKMDRRTFLGEKL